MKLKLVVLSIIKLIPQWNHISNAGNALKTLRYENHTPIKLRRLADMRKTRRHSGASD